MRKSIYAFTVLVFITALIGTFYGINCFAKWLQMSSPEKYVLYTLAVIVFVFLAFMIDSATARKRIVLRREHDELIRSIDEFLAGVAKLKPDCDAIKKMEHWETVKPGLNDYIETYQWRHDIPTRLGAISNICSRENTTNSEMISFFACITDQDISVHRQWAKDSYDFLIKMAE